MYARASLGALHHEWQEEVQQPAAGVLVVRLTVPAQARLDDLADDYLTDLAVRLDAFDAAGLRAFDLVAPPAFLTWSTGTAKVWDESTAMGAAPRGILSSALRDQLAVADGTAARAMAPIFREGVPLGDETETDPDRDQFDHGTEGN